MITKELWTAVEGVVVESVAVDWLILWKVADRFPASESARFTFMEREERMDEPFRYRQGYMTVAHDEFDDFKAKLEKLMNDKKDDLIALGNLFVITSLVSNGLSDRDELQDFYKQVVGRDRLPQVFEVLMASLNDKFFEHANVSRDEEMDAERWFRLFNGSGPAARHGERLTLIVYLVSEDIMAGVGIQYVRQMKPLIRAFLSDYYGMGVSIGTDELKALDGDDMAFLAAYLADRSRGRLALPDWLTGEFVQRLFLDWKRSGSFLVKEVLGRPTHGNMAGTGRRQLENIVQSVIEELLVSESADAADWIMKLEFPKEVVAVAACIGGAFLDYNAIPAANRVRLFRNMVGQWKSVCDHIGLYMGDDKDRKGPSDWFIREPKFQYMLCLLLLLYMDVEDDEALKRFKDVCFETKLLFYGGYKSSSSATKMAEAILLMALSGYALTDISEEMFGRLDKLQADIVKSFLVPFVHTIEREEEIWNPEYEGVIGLMRSGDLLVNDALARIKGGSLLPRYKILFSAIDEIAVARWPYMDGRKVPARKTGLGGRGVNISVGE